MSGPNPNGRDDALKGRGPANKPNWTDVERKTYDADFKRAKQGK